MSKRKQSTTTNARLETDQEHWSASLLQRSPDGKMLHFGTIHPGEALAGTLPTVGDRFHFLQTVVVGEGNVVGSWLEYCVRERHFLCRQESDRTSVALVVETRRLREDEQAALGLPPSTAEPIPGRMLIDKPERRTEERADAVDTNETGEESAEPDFPGEAKGDAGLSELAVVHVPVRRTGEAIE